MKTVKKNKNIKNYLFEYLDYLEIEKGLSNNTQKNYSRYLNVFFSWLNDTGNGDLSPAKLGEDHIWEYRVSLSQRKLSKSSQNVYLIALRSLLEFFEERKIKSLYPAKIKLPKKKSIGKIKVLTIEDLKKVLDSPNQKTRIGLRDKALMETFFSTGLRIAELVALNRDQIKIDKSQETLELSIIGKGNKIRTVYFSKRSLKYLKKYINLRNDLDPSLFINYRRGADNSNESRRLAIGSIQQIVKKYFKLAAVSKDATPHTFRHTFATDLLNSGIDIRLVQEFLGHKSVSTTQVYTHVTNKQLKDVHKKLHGGKSLKA